MRKWCPSRRRRARRGLAKPRRKAARSSGEEENGVLKIPPLNPDFAFLGEFFFQNFGPSLRGF